MSLSELLRAQEQGKARRLVGLTFDDGYGDYVEQALPILQRHGMTSTLYAVAGRIGGTNDHACVIGDYEPGDRFTLPRCYVSPRDTPAHLLARMARHWVRLRVHARRDETKS